MILGINQLNIWMEMRDLDALLKPVWGAEKWISEGWQALNKDEQQVVVQRMETLFSEGLPFELAHDRMLYIYAFAFLAQLEVLAIQVPLQFEKQMPNDVFKQRMRQQLIDEVFHGMVFTRILYELITPYAMPPAYNEEIEDLCDFIRNESCPKVAVVLLNLVAEALIEELFRAFHQADIAPMIFSTILADEHRHVCEADLYREIGLPSSEILTQKIAVLEDKLISSIYLNQPYTSSLRALVGTEGLRQCFMIQDNKYREQLSKLNLSPGKMWSFFTTSRHLLLPQIKQYTSHNYPVDMSETSQALMTQWKAPADPTMVGEFDLNIDRLDFFGKKHPSETLSLLMLQTISQAVSDNPVSRTYLSYQRLYQNKDAYVALAVKLPGCDEHLGMMVFRNCHQRSIASLGHAVQQNLQMMIICYNKRFELERKYPEFLKLKADIMQQIGDGVYPYPMPGNPIVSASNNGVSGYQRGKSPLRTSEALKFTWFAVQRKPVWDETSKMFKPQDCLPISVSADHRIFNGDIPVPRHLKTAFNQVLDNMLHAKPSNTKKPSIPMDAQLEMLNLSIKKQPRVAYKFLLALQMVWPDFLDFLDVLDMSEWIKMSEKIKEI